VTLFRATVNFPARSIGEPQISYATGRIIDGPTKMPLLFSKREHSQHGGAHLSAVGFTESIRMWVILQCSRLSLVSPHALRRVVLF